MSLACAAIVGAAGFSSAGAGAQINPPVSVFVDATKLPSSAVAIVNGRVYVAMRALGRSIGADVSYNPRKRQVTVTTLLHQSVIRVGGQAGGATIIHGQVMVSLRDLAKALDVRMAYDAANHAVHVNTSGLQAPPVGAPTPPSIARTNTLEGTVTHVNAQAQPAAIEIQSNQVKYTITIPPGTPIQFRDTHGAIAGHGGIAQVKPGDELIATVDAAGRLLSIADVFAGTSGTVAAISGNAMVLTNGTVITADQNTTAVNLDGLSAGLADLKAGDIVNVRANPQTGKVREIVALSPAGARAATLPATSSTNSSLMIAHVNNDAAALHAGQTLHVSASGTSNAAASFDLSNIVLGVGMRETNPGHYEGAYVVEVGTNMVDAPLFVRLRKGNDVAVAAASTPLTIITQPPEVRDTAPANGARINTMRPSIYATFATLGGKGMNTGSLRLFVNGRDVSDQSTLTAGFVSYYPATDLSAGPISVEVKGADIAGNALDYRWSFVIRVQ